MDKSFIRIVKATSRYNIQTNKSTQCLKKFVLNNKKNIIKEKEAKNKLRKRTYKEIINTCRLAEQKGRNSVFLNFYSL